MIFGLSTCNASWSFESLRTDSSCKLKGFSLKSSFSRVADCVIWQTASDDREKILFLLKLTYARLWREHSSIGYSVNWLSCKTRISSFSSLVKWTQSLPFPPLNLVSLFLARESHLRLTRFPSSSPISEMLFPTSESLSSFVRQQTLEGKPVRPMRSNHRLLRFMSLHTTGGKCVKGLSLRLRNWRLFLREENTDGNSVSWLFSRERYSKFHRWDTSSGGIMIWLLLRSNVWRDESFESSAGMTFKSRWLKFRIRSWFFLVSSTIWRIASIFYWWFRPLNPPQFSCSVSKMMGKLLSISSNHAHRVKHQGDVIVCGKF